MAKNYLSGITLQIGGDTSQLSQALKVPNQEANELQQKLKAINTALKLDPTNTDLLAQKQELLGDAIEKNEERLKLLKKAQEQFISSGGDLNSREYIELEKQIAVVENQIKKAKDQQTIFNEHIVALGVNLDKIGTKAESFGKKLLPASGAMAALGAYSTKTAIDFEDAMSQAAGALDMPMEKMGDLRELALQTGQDTIFSATEAGQAITELAKGGLTEAQIQGGALATTMDLAASSQMDLATSANVVVQAMGAFHLEADQSAEAANALAGAAAASSTDVEPLTEGLAQCSAQAYNAGWSIQETTAALALFADAGVTGSDAGTSLKTMLQRLAAPTDEAAGLIESLGIQTRDSNGELLSATEMAQELQNKLGGLSNAERDAALQTIFGSDATRAATIMMNAGADGLKKYTDATNDQEAAARLANSQMSDWSRSIEELQGSLETAAIIIGDKLAPMVAGLADGISGLIDWFSNLDPALQNIVIGIGGVVAAAGPLLIIFGKMEQGLNSLIELGPNIKKVFTGIGDTFKSLKKIGETAFNGLKSVGSTAFNAIKSGAQTFASFIKTTLVSAFNGLKSVASVAFEGVKTAATTAFNAILAHPIIAGITAIIAVIVLLYTKCEWFRDKVNELLAWLGDQWNSFVSFWAQKGQDLITWFQELPGKIANFVSNIPNMMFNLGKNIIDSIISGIGSLFGSLGNAAADIANTIIDAVKNLPSAMFNIGANLLSGLWDGISSGIGNLWNNVTSWGSDFLGGIANFFGIHSPSTVFRDFIGKNLMAGLGEGIINNEDLALSPLNELEKKIAGVALSSDVSGQISKSLQLDNSITVTSPIEIDLDGKPIYQNVVTRITRTQGMRSQFKGGYA